MTPPLRHARRRLAAGIAGLVALVAAVTIAVLVAAPGAAPTAHTTAHTTAATPTPAPTTPAAAKDTSCTPQPGYRPTTAPTARRPATRAVNIGFEDVTSTDPNDLTRLAQRLDQVDANTVSIAVGRVDWVGFPWAGHEDVETPTVQRTGEDLVARAIAALRCQPDGTPRRVILGVDASLGRLLQQHPDWAGQFQDGTTDPNFPSITAWKDDGLAQRLVDFVHEVAVRYHPDAVNVTELLFSTETYGPDDLKDFTAATGEKSWPLDPDGSINLTDPALMTWHTDTVNAIASEIKAALAPTGVPLTLDVRSPISDTPLGRPDSGENYPDLLRYADRLNIWDFPGVDTSGTYGAAKLGASFLKSDPSRYSLEIGIWQGAGTIPANVLQRELSVANSDGVQSVSVTPASLMTDQLWSTLQRAWNP